MLQQNLAADEINVNVANISEVAESPILTSFAAKKSVKIHSCCQMI